MILVIALYAKDTIRAQNQCRKPANQKTVSSVPIPSLLKGLPPNYRPLESRASLRTHVHLLSPWPMEYQEHRSIAGRGGRGGNGEGLTGNQWELEGYLEGTLAPPGTCWDGICGPDLAWGPLPSCQSWLRSAAEARPCAPSHLQDALLRETQTEQSSISFRLPPGSAVLRVLFVGV